MPHPHAFASTRRPLSRRRFLRAAGVGVEATSFGPSTGMMRGLEVA
jgi:hypothetical protein